ncbi:MAG: tetratricopeptide repeat protein [Moraxellaceae bacterium]|nr:tetratricopeptide repeat protein [Moraxellaceae bacterium]
MTPLNKKTAIALHQANQLAQAQAIYQKLLQQTPTDADLWHRLGVLYLQQNQLEKAQDSLQKALSYQQKSPMLWLHYGVVLGLLNQHQLAQQSFESGLSCQLTATQQVDLYYHHAIALNKQHHIQQALQSIAKVLQQQPHHVIALNLQGTLYLQYNDYLQALHSYQLATQLKADFSEAWYHCGLVLEKIKRYHEAVNHYQKAISLKPHYINALNNCANVLVGLQDYPQAIKLLTQLVESNYPYAVGRIFYLQTHICDWKDYHATVAFLRQGIAQQQALISPFEFFNVPASPHEQLMCAESYVLKNYPAQSTPLWNGEIYQHAKIKIAYISADFYNHATSILMIELFEQHDRSQFEIIALAFNSKNDEMTVRVKAAFDRYIDVSQYTDLQVAQLIKSLQIDIAVDLKGHTQDARLGIFAYKAAPIQVNYLGQASTIGASYIDYILADRHIVPPQYHTDFSEKVVCLPHTYYVNDSKRPISSQVFSRGELGLPESGFVFCCFNNSYKISPAMFDVWMRLLQQVPHSVLWLLEGNATARQNLYNEAKRRGVAPSRLVFAPKVASSVHLARHQHADLFLDTLPINAHTTACDALWARVPIVTCMGQTFASRVAASILTAVGLPELITQNLADYEALALKLATSPLWLAQIKQKLQHREQSPLFDIKAQRIAFESAYKTMYQCYQQGLVPQAFNV